MRTPGSVANSFKDSLVESIDLIGLIARQPGVHVETDEMVGRKSQGHRLKIAKCANEQSRANEQQEAESDLHPDQNATEA